MGFAGQVFAARVAIGLAVPSARSLTSTGHMIGKAASKMYTDVNQMSIKAAKQRTADTLKNLNQARTNVQKFQDSTSDKLLKSAAASINKTNKLYQGNLAKSGKQVTAMKTNVKKMTRGMGVAPKLFQGLKKDMSAARQYSTMLKNFIFLHRDERKAVLEAMKAHFQLAAQRAQEAADLAKQGKVTKAHAQRLIRDAQKKENTFRQFAQADKDRTIAKNKLAREEKALNSEVAKSTKEYTQALKEEGQIIDEVNIGAKEMYERTQQFVYELKRGFIDGLRESISILTAFYYKLNESAMELAEFERELLNANSVFALTREELFDTSQAIVQFSQEFGLAMDNGASGLYQLASAGLSAEEAMAVLPETLKLSMAVQGDHNTISKLTTQTLFGFGMEVSEAGELTDKFAHAIQKSLIEYQDLTSAIKFALPFFTATGQSIDQLLGSLQVLTNRALEAGIAGRGLRQALAEFAESAEDNQAAFRSMGIDILNAEGEMKQLTEIAKDFAAVVGPETASNTELLTTLIQDLNVRGATAFIHLVQNAEEFEQAVLDTANAGGELDEMVRIQNESISAQMQILRNNVRAIFTMKTANDDGTDSINDFHQGVLDLIASMRNLIVVEQQGEYVLTQFGMNMRRIAVTGVEAFTDLAKDLVQIINDFTKQGFLNISMLKAYFIPLKIVVEIIERMGPGLIKAIIWIRIINSLLPVSTLMQWAYAASVQAAAAAEAKALQMKIAGAAATHQMTLAVQSGTAANVAFTASMAGPTGMLKGFIRLLHPVKLAVAAVVVTVGAIAASVIHLKGALEGVIIGFKLWKTMFSAAIQPLRDLAGELQERFGAVFGVYGQDESRAKFINFMNQVGAILATAVYLMSQLIAWVTRFSLQMWDIHLGPALTRVLDFASYVKSGDFARDIGQAYDDSIGTPMYNVKRDYGYGALMSGEGGYAPGTGGGVLRRTGQGAVAGAMAGAAYGIYGAWGGPVGVAGATLAGATLGAIVGGGAGLLGGIAEYGSYQAGGYMTPTPMAAGGYLVGERGPELFMPRVGGKILNTDRTRDLLDGQRSGAITGSGMVNQLVVANLIADKSVSRNSKISVDTFAGVV